MGTYSAISLTETSANYSIRQHGDFEESWLFPYISFFLLLITPTEFPLEILHNATHSNVTFVELLSEAIRIEAGFLCIMCISITLWLVPIGFTVAWCCKISPPEPEPEEHIDPLMSLDDTEETGITWKKRISIIALFVMFLIMISCDVGIFVANSQLYSSLDTAPNIIKTSIEDIELFVRKTHTQVQKLVDTDFDASIKLVMKDLEDIDMLLGDSIKTEVSANTGIDLTFDSLATISAANAELIGRVGLLHDSISKSLKISQEAAARMEELQIQLSVLQRQCTFRDRPLCDTLRLRSFEENGIIEAFKQLQEDQGIFQMRYLGELEIGTTVKTLPQELSISKSIFGNFPNLVKSDTLYARNETVEQLENIKTTATSTAQTLTQIINSILEHLSGAWENLEPQLFFLKDFSRVFWGLAWSTAMTILFVLIFILLTFCCTFCGSNVKAGVLLVTSVVFICVGSTILMVFAIFSLFIGGNGEIFICNPLYNEADYEMFSKIFDNPGLIYSKPKPHGVINEWLKPPYETDHVVNVSLASVLQNCEDNHSSYSVFKLGTFINKSRIVDLKDYPKVTAALDLIKVSEKPLLSLTEVIRHILEHMLQTVDLNLTAYRTSISQPTPEKDLAIFIDQMQRVSLQIQDVPTSSRMTTLGSRAKRLQASVLQPLEQLRSEILYHLTALELQKEPWAKQVNHTLYHLRNIQSYLETAAKEICENETRIYINKLKLHLTSPENNTSFASTDSTESCRPLFDVFNVNRAFLCHYGLDMINGLAFTTFVCLLLWSIGTPTALNLITLHNKLKTVTGLRRASSRLYGTPPNRLLISEQSNWGAPTSTQPATMGRSNWSLYMNISFFTLKTFFMVCLMHTSLKRTFRQDSVRSVRWETTEIAFEDDDAPNFRENLV